MAPTLDTLGPVMQGALVCLDAALTANGRPAALVHLAPGQQVAWDNCCEGGGQAYVRVVQMYPSGSPFPQADIAQQCGVLMLAARLGIGVIRCAHVLNDQGVPPTAEQMTTDTLSTTLDAAIILEVIRCCLPEIPGVKSLKVDTGTPQGVLGGCAGWEWQVVVAIDLCACPDG